ncbi:hypothetical protein AMJ49_07345 [Parcubacteria bacterium DG_74_2]|nr:MAG: hypothetical protein AMJ49_07345 [Parcubacteria bacterium DG_74_2]
MDWVYKKTAFEKNGNFLYIYTFGLLYTFFYCYLLKKWTDENNIEKIKTDYFGGGDVIYYLGDKWENLDPLLGPQKGWLAISATFLQGGKGNPTPGFDQSFGYYRWLDDYEPVTRIGTSIFVYYIE